MVQVEHHTQSFPGVQLLNKGREGWALFHSELYHELFMLWKITLPTAMLPVMSKPVIQPRVNQTTCIALPSAEFISIGTAFRLCPLIV